MSTTSYSRYQHALHLLILSCCALGWLFASGSVQAAEPAPSVESITYGTSVEGRPLQAFRLGRGPRQIVIAGAIHGNEANTADLVTRLQAAMGTFLDRMPPDVSLYFIPMLNPDGVAHATRYNVHGVDLNRNWASSDWRSDTRDAAGLVRGAGGPAPFSEPESKALADFLWQLRDPAAPNVLFLSYHAQYPPAGLVMAGTVGQPLTRAFAAQVDYQSSSETTGFSAYPVTGSSIAWCADVGLRCFDVELPNRAAVSAASLQRHALAVLSVLLWEQQTPRQRCFSETGMCIAGRIRSVWEQNHGMVAFGLPLTRQQELTQDGTVRQVQWFERARLELVPGQAAPYDVQIGRLGAETLARQGRDWWSFPRSAPQPDCKFFPETGQQICGPFLKRWESLGVELDGRAGTSDAERLALFGLPLSPAQPETRGNGETRIVQWFERARLERPAEAAPQEQVQLSLLGTEFLAAEPRSP